MCKDLNFILSLIFVHCFDNIKKHRRNLFRIGNRLSFNRTAYAEIKENITIKTCQDHRMAMAFAPLAPKVPIRIEDAEVVSKSYPNFWEDIKTVGFTVNAV